ncbi:MAG: TIGR04149 family rSAM-modified RiPP [Hyphomicrobiales bacterium]
MKSLKLNSIKKDSLIKEDMRDIIGCEDKITCVCGCRGKDSSINNGLDNKKKGLCSAAGGLDFSNYEHKEK